LISLSVWLWAAGATAATVAKASKLRPSREAIFLMAMTWRFRIDEDKQIIVSANLSRGKDRYRIFMRNLCMTTGRRSVIAWSCSSVHQLVTLSLG